MSAIAIHCTDKEIILLSEGNQWHVETGEMLRNDASKIYPVASNCAVLGMGWSEDGRKIIEEAKQQRIIPNLVQPTPEMVAGLLAETMQQIYTQENINPHEYLYLIVGYGEDGPELWELLHGSKRAEEWGFHSEADGYTPVKRKIEPGSSLSIAVGVPATETTFASYMETQLEAGEDPRMAATQSFKRMVNEYQEQGMYCGGETFMSVLKKKRQPQPKKSPIVPRISKNIKNPV